MKTIKNTFVIIILLLLPFMVGCDNDTDLSDGYLTAVITAFDQNCNACILTFTDDKKKVENLLGTSENNLYLAVNLNEDLSNQIGKSIKVKVRRAAGNEIASCSSNYSAIFVLDYFPVTFTYNEEFEIPVKGSMQSRDKLYILRFDSVLTDSRCPEGLYCFWQGIAGVRFTLTKNYSAPESVDLYTWNNPAMNWSDSADCKNLNIRLLGLNPYPSTNARYGNNSYKAKIIITLKK